MVESCMSRQHAAKISSLGHVGECEPSAEVRNVGKSALRAGRE
jgi:hypothetical protein